MTEEQKQRRLAIKAWAKRKAGVTHLSCPDSEIPKIVAKAFEPNALTKSEATFAQKQLRVEIDRLKKFFAKFNLFF